MEAPNPYDFGLMGSSGFYTGVFLRSPFSPHILDNSVPDLQITVFPSVTDPAVFDADSRKSRRLSESFFQFPNISFPSHKSVDVLITVVLLDPDAEYEVVINSEFPFTKQPDIRIPSDRDTYLSDRDANILGWGIEKVRLVLATPPIAASILEENYPGASVKDETLINWV